MAKANEPVQDAMKAYFELALGLTEASKKKAEKTVKKVAREVLGRGGATASQLQSMAEDVISTGLANREAVVKLVQAELERALGKVGLVKSEEVDALTARIDELERQLAGASGGAKPAVSKAALAKASTTTPAAAKKALAKKTLAKKVVAKPAADTTVPSSKAVAKSTAAAGAAPVTATAPASKTATATAPSSKSAAKAAPVSEAAPAGAAASKPAAPSKTAASKAAPSTTAPSKAAASKVAPSKAAAKKAPAAKATAEPVPAVAVEPPGPVRTEIESEISAASTSVAPALFIDSGADDVPAAVKKAPAKKIVKKAPAKKAARS